MTQPCRNFNLGRISLPAVGQFAAEMGRVEWTAHDGTRMRLQCKLRTGLALASWLVMASRCLRIFLFEVSRFPSSTPGHHEIYLRFDTNKGNFIVIVKIEEVIVLFILPQTF